MESEGGTWMRMEGESDEAHDINNKVEGSKRSCQVG